jgi:sulfide dehydrogenase cytochrome subunit
MKAALWATLALGISLPVLAEEAIPTGVMLANNCTGCHGSDGASNGPSIPSIGGLSADYFISIMEAYRNGAAYSTIMGRIVKGYSEKEVEAMAKYYAEKSFVGSKQDTNAKLVKQGATLHQKYCETCHEDNGSESEDAGVLAGQWKPYLEWAITDFKDKAREVDKKMLKQLDKALSKSGDSGIGALANFYAAQKK